MLLQRKGMMIFTNPCGFTLDNMCVAIGRSEEVVSSKLCRL